MSNHFEDVAYVVHDGGPGGGGHTLCGDSLDGETGDQSMIATTKRINCPRCVQVIEHAKAIKRNAYSPLGATKR